MKTLNLISVEKSDIRYTRLVFPDGQPHIKIDVSSFAAADTSCKIISRISSANDLLLLLFVKNTRL